jgi:hexosaminidase
MSEVKKLLSIASRLGLNKFHFHFADDQGFRIDLKKYPRLGEIASKRRGTFMGGPGHHKELFDPAPHSGFYSEEEITGLLDYAGKLGIEVIPELDIPGHSGALLAAYPELACEGLAPIETPNYFGVLDNIICLGSDEAMSFIDGLLHELCRLFKAKTFHLGFDEVVLDHLKSCPRCQTRIKKLGLKNEEGLKGWAKNYFRDSLQKMGVKIIFYNDGMEAPDHSVTVFHWETHNNLTERTIGWANQGQSVIMAPLDYYYLDYPYCRTPLRATYNFDPVYPGITRSESVIGVEAPIWTEYITGHGKLAFNAYYRLAAFAESAWYAPKDKPPYEDFMKELRASEEELFGERLDIPEAVLNPPPDKAKRLSEAWNANPCVEYEEFCK